MSYTLKLKYMFIWPHFDEGICQKLRLVLIIIPTGKYGKRKLAVSYNPTEQTKLTSFKIRSIFRKQ